VPPKNSRRQQLLWPAYARGISAPAEIEASATTRVTLLSFQGIHIQIPATVASNFAQSARFETSREGNSGGIHSKFGNDLSIGGGSRTALQRTSLEHLHLRRPLRLVLASLGELDFKVEVNSKLELEADSEVMTKAKANDSKSNSSEGHSEAADLDFKGAAGMAEVGENFPSPFY